MKNSNITTMTSYPDITISLTVNSPQQGQQIVCQSTERLKVRVYKDIMRSCLSC